MGTGRTEVWAVGIERRHRSGVVEGQAERQAHSSSVTFPLRRRRSPMGAPPLHGLEAQPCTVGHDLEPGVGTDAEGSTGGRRQVR